MKTDEIVLQILKLNKLIRNAKNSGAKNNEFEKKRNELTDELNKWSRS